MADTGAIELSPITVVGQLDTGYAAQRAISATRTAAERDEIPQTVEVRSRQVIEDVESVRVGDALRYGAGLVNDFGSPGNRFGDSFFSRGFASNFVNNGLRRWMELGDWLVGLAGMAMLVLLVSGVVIHRKIFIQFFTFRPDKKLPRSSLDLHNLTGVLVLPFHLVITLSGLIIFFSLYFPTVISTVYQGDPEAFFKDTYGIYRRDQAGKPAALASLEAMAQDASHLWDGGRPSFVRVWHPGDVNSIVEMRRWFPDDAVTMKREVIYFDGTTGAVLHTHTARPVGR